MSSSFTPRLRTFSKFLFAGLSALTVVACGGGGGGGISTFSSRQTAQSMDVSFPAVVAGDWAAYRAVEASTGPSGTDLDGDGSTDDKVTFALNLMDGTETSSNLNAAKVFIIGDTFFMVVDELVAGTDLGGTAAADELLLMTWDPTAGVDPVYVDTLDRAASVRAVATTDRLYYVADAAPAALETNVRFLDITDVTLPVTVGVATGTITSARILGEREDLVLLTLDETVDGDLDGDMDGTDAFVLALLDGTDVAALLEPTAVTIGGPTTPFDAEALDVAGDGTADDGWLVGVFADEVSMGADLNDPALFSGAWRPGQCAASADGDQTDDVLFYIYYNHPTFTSTPVNTGLVGRNVVHVVDGSFVATISPEAEANCDLNQDGDMGDLVPRWCKAVDPALGSMGLLPPGATSLMDAVAASPAGGSFGLVKLAGNLIALVDEATDNTDHNADGLKTAMLIAYVDNLDTDLAWNYNLVDPDTGNDVTVGASWLGNEPAVDRIGIGLEESVADQNLNNGCGLDPKDGDKTDSVGAWLHFESAGLVVPGIGFATQPFNAGITFAGGNAFFNVDEAGDDYDYNGDGDKFDQILVRNPLGPVGCQPKAMGTMSSSFGLAITSDSVQRGGVFVGDEDAAKFDFNKDGDKNDMVLRWIRFF